MARLNLITGQKKDKTPEFPKQNQTIITGGGFNPGRYYNKSQIDSFLNNINSNWGGIGGTLSDQTDLQAELDGKSDVGHTHDDRYYTESEVDALLAAIDVVITGDKDTIAATTPSAPVMAIVTSDHGGETITELMGYNGSVWKLVATQLSTESENPDAGPFQNGSRLGYGPKSIIGKATYDMVMGYGDRAVKGAYRLDTTQDPPVFQIWFNGQYNSYFVFDISSGTLKHDYLGSTFDVYSGNSNRIGANGKPLAAQYNWVAGPCGSEPLVQG